MSTAVRSPLLALAPTAILERPLARSTAIELALVNQQTLTAVERFSRAHDGCAVSAEGRIYRDDLIPAARPQPGQQYAFEVDLDLCTGCKACVTGCHNLNGLDEGEVWRTVGLLHGGTREAPAQQTVTTACHHCLEPACMLGCPVKAYDKDPVTGIVKHLDDQCIGCQYCVFMCPYDAPKFIPSRGIVRKCDMCSDRLAHDEAPACVEACPNEAIRITVVDRAEAIQATEAGSFLPGVPGPADTLPTTVYKTEKVLPRNMLPADFYSVSPEHAHPPLVIMLVLTQLSVGAFILNLLARAVMGTSSSRPLEIANALFSLALGLAALGASTLHLGRPQFAFRAFLGLRTSWLSREILTFSAFAGLSMAFAASFFAPFPVGRLPRVLGAGAAVAGALGVFSSVMVYAATKRAHWRGSVTGFKFGLTTLVLGSAAVSMVSLVSTAILAPRGAAPLAFLTSGAYPVLATILMLAAGVKLTSEVAAFRHLGAPHHTVEKRVALLLKGDLRRFVVGRFLCGVVGGLLLPAVGLALVRYGHAPALPVLAGGAALAFLLSLVGEMLERYLFFAGAPASRMPGGIG